MNINDIVSFGKRVELLQGNIKDAVSLSIEDVMWTCITRTEDIINVNKAISVSLSVTFKILQTVFYYIFLLNLNMAKNGFLVSKLCEKVLVSEIYSLGTRRKLNVYKTFRITSYVQKGIHRESLIHFSPLLHFYTHWKHQKTYGFLTFLWVIEIWHWTKIG